MYFFLKNMNSISERIFKILQEKCDENLSSDGECELPFECHLCGAVYFMKLEFYAHIESHNKKKKNVNNEKSYECTFDGCKKLFSRNSDLQKHLVNYITLLKIIFM
jgi:hypothetical protein